MKLVVVSSDLPQVYCSLLPKLELVDALSSLLIFLLSFSQTAFWPDPRSFSYEFGSRCSYAVSSGAIVDFYLL